MRRLPFVLAVLAMLPPLLVACLQNISTGTGTTDPSATATATAAATSTATPTGSACGTDVQTQVTLCAGIDQCPGIVVDQSTLPGCGFRIHAGAVIDLECLCTDVLCPIGVADTCEQVTSLLSSQTSLSVCEQASEGHCLQVGAPAATGTATATAAPTSPPSSCDRTCESECAGEPDCIQLCGC